MFAAVGVGAYAVAIFHLVCHAFFKALLFLGAGSVIHGLGGEQDMRKMGGLAPRMMTTTVTFLVGGLGLSGVPPLAGFFSKDAILEAAWNAGHRSIWFLLLAGAFMTAVYTFRVIFLSFFGGPRMSHEVAHHVHESPPVMTVPLIVLSVLTIVAGLAVGIPSSHGTAFERFLTPVLPRHEAEHSSGTAFALLVVSVVFVLAGIAIAWMMYGRGEVRAERIGVPTNAIHALVLNKYYVDEIYDFLFVRPVYAASQWCARVFDAGLIDGLVDGVGRMMTGWALGMRRVQTGFVMNYALAMLLGAVAVVALLLTRR
jgi:NADH-quinone oxidoreductase subunit L